MRLAGRYCFTAIHANIALSKTEAGIRVDGEGSGERDRPGFRRWWRRSRRRAYARGRADARKEMLTALGATGEPPPRPQRGSPRAARPARKSRAGGGKRAPKGSARALIERALRDRPEATPRDILNCAATDAERLVKLGSIRVELHTGRRRGRYESEDGRWSLATSSLERRGRRAGRAGLSWCRRLGGYSRRRLPFGYRSVPGTGRGGKRTDRRYAGRELRIRGNRKPGRTRAGSA